MNILTEDTKATILLCGILGKKRTINPLTQTEYTRLVHWLINAQLRPSSLLNPEYIKDAASGAGLDEKRINSLLNRGTQLGFAVENWQRNSIWVISRSDKDYPARYKQHLKDKAPPLLFGVGDLSLLRGGGLAIVGSRNVDEIGESFTKDAARNCVECKMPVVSGGARGVDQVSMEAALDAGGSSIGIVADNLLKKSIGKKFRKAISRNRLLLISPYHPEARFTVGTAMGRNKFIYAMADFALIVSAEYKKGGTWAGATEELRRDISIPVFTRIDKSVPKGNKKLLDHGAIKWPAIPSAHNLNLILRQAANSFMEKQKQNNMTLFNQAPQMSDQKINKNLSEKKTVADKLKIENRQESNSSPSPIYEAVLPLILHNLDSPLEPDNLAKKLEVQKGQLNIWLKKAVIEGKIKKLIQPVRYTREEG